MIVVKLTQTEARKLRDLIEKLKKQGSKDPDLYLIHHKIHHALQQPAVKRKYPVEKDPLKAITVRIDSDD